PPVRGGVTVRTGLEALIGGEKLPVALTVHPGCAMFSRDAALLEDAMAAVADCATVVAVAGGSSSRFGVQGEFDANGAMKEQTAVTMDCGESVACASLALPGDQLALLGRLKAAGKRVVTVLIGGRPYEMGEIDRCSDAILCCFYPGPTGGEAIAKLLFGFCEPAGRLCVSLPDETGQLPVYYNAKDSCRSMAYYNDMKSTRLNSSHLS